MATTFGDLKTAVQNNALSSDATNAGIYINDGYIDVVSQFELGATSVTKNLVANQTSYNFTSDWSLSVLKILAVRYLQSGQTYSYSISLAPSLDEVLDLNQSGVVGFLREYTLLGRDTIVFSPAPATGDQVTIYYVPVPTALSAAGDIPSTIPSQFQFRLLSYYGSWMLGESEDAGLAEQYHAKYVQACADMQSWMNRRQGAQSRGTRVGYPDRTPKLPHDRSTYWSNEWS